MLPIVYAAALFSVVTFGGLAALRAITNVAARAIFFLVLCCALVKGTFWLSGRWSLNTVEIGVAWGAALLVIVGLEVMRAWRKRRIIM
ncbi:MAG: hypothetical protein ACJ78M_11885 [Gemmatimonadaceae bacterium]